MEHRTSDLLDAQLLSLGLPNKHLHQMRNEGHIILERESSPSILLVATVNRKQLLLTSSLIAVPAPASPRLMAYALHLNFLPQHTFSANIAYDIDNNQLCLRYCHELTNHYGSLIDTLNNFSQLTSQVILSLQQFQARQS